MNYTEELLWILDKPGTDIHNQEEKFQENIAFVHSLGLKCDSVGWSKLSLEDPRAMEILDKIAAFCKETGWQARCWYTRCWVRENSDWYKLVPRSFQDSTFAETVKLEEFVRTYNIRAFYENGVGMRDWGFDLFAPEKFREFCLQKLPEELDFCWAKDIGKYEAAQYFQVFGKRLIPQVALTEKLDHKALKKMDGWLPKIAEVFHQLQQINLPDCYLAQDLPQGGMASLCYIQTCRYPFFRIPPTYREMRRNTLLIHRDTARMLLEAKLVAPRELQPVPVVEAVPQGYSLVSTQLQPRPDRAVMAQQNAAYEALRKKQRPVRAVTEKEALKLLRGAKKQRKADFQKAMPKARAENLGPYSPAAPYYLVANGGWLSEEYQLLPYERALEETVAFTQQMEKEELLEERIRGVVIAGCPDGDKVLLWDDGSVRRFSHEEPAAIAQWPSLAQFIAETIEE